MKVIDLFCGCGGLSLGLRMAGFEVVYGLDSNTDSITTFKRNFPEAIGESGKVENLSNLLIPEADIIVGGPPCVNFSTSKGSRANVLEGLKLVQAFLRFIWERKPKYWLMENVPKIGLHLPQEIPLKWIGVNEEGFLEVPVRKLFDISAYGAPQKRTRLLIGNFPIPVAQFVGSSEPNLINYKLQPTRTLGQILNSFPEPGEKKSCTLIKDPIYGVEIPHELLTDHHQSTELSEVEERKIRDAKVNHPYMGRMQFPDNPDSPARTVVALQMGRETLVVKTSLGKFRRITVRECASLQTFPISFQFSGKTIASRYRQAGNAVPPVLTFEIGKEIIKLENLETLSSPSIKFPEGFPPANKGLSKKKRIIQYKKSRSILFPGKELRGFRIELRSTAGEDPYWRSILHMGEGKQSHQKLSLSFNEVNLLAQRSLRRYDHEALNQYINLLKEVALLQTRTGKEVHNYLHEAYGCLPDCIKKFVDLINTYFPQERWSKVDIPLLNRSCTINRKFLRLRLVISLPICKILEAKLNNEFSNKDFSIELSDEILHPQNDKKEDNFLIAS